MHKITVTNIISVSYSGSTWLNLLLGSHPQSFSAGEMKQLLKPGDIHCTIHGDTCPLWSRFDLTNGENPFVQLARLTGRRHLIINNSRKLLQDQEDAQIESKFVHLVRDGRAVLASFLRKRSDLSAWSASRLIAHDVRRDLRLIRRQPADSTITVRYEDLQDDMEGQLKRLCAFIGMDYDPVMQQFWKPDHHFIGGNRGTLFGMLRRSDRLEQADDNITTSKKLNWDLPYYENVDVARFKDERWKQELTNGQMRMFALTAGRLHRKLGYGSAMDRG